MIRSCLLMKERELIQGFEEVADKNKNYHEKDSSLGGNDKKTDFDIVDPEFFQHNEDDLDETDENNRNIESPFPPGSK